MRIYIVLTLFLVWDLLWLVVVDRRLVSIGVGRKARLLNLFFFFLMVIGIVIVLYLPKPLSRVIQLHLPWPYLGMLFLWHLVFAPIGLAMIGLDWMAELAGKFVRPGRVPEPSPVAPQPTHNVPDSTSGLINPPAPQGMTRRQLITASVLAAPPLLLVGGTSVGMAQIGTLRVREFTVPIKNLSHRHNGLRIVHISDTHYGRFTDQAFTDNLVSTINRLEADLHLVTGDLIDSSLLDLEHGLNMLRLIKSPNPIFCCVGNHDLFMSRFGFIDRVKASGTRLLVDEYEQIRPRGEPLNILGVDWSTRENDMANSVNYTTRDIDPDIPSILLAHHPHVFKYAGPKGIDLTLSGHTHGGQIMLTKNFGPGPFMYDYWSGIYEKQGKHLAVSNGVGNWFPLRVNAPAELLLIRLTQG